VQGEGFTQRARERSKSVLELPSGTAHEIKALGKQHGMEAEAEAGAGDF
jgi:hypothetical protein